MPTHQKPERDKEPLHKVATRWLNKNWILINYSILVLIFTGIAMDHLWTVFNDAEQYSRSWVSQKYEERLFYFTTTLISYYYFVDFNKKYRKTMHSMIHKSRMKNQKIANEKKTKRHFAIGCTLGLIWLLMTYSLPNLFTDYKSPTTCISSKTQPIVLH